jgi:hypothetical protein
LADRALFDAFCAFDFLNQPVHAKANAGDERSQNQPQPQRQPASLGLVNFGHVIPFLG